MAQPRRYPSYLFGGTIGEPTSICGAGFPSLYRTSLASFGREGSPSVRRVVQAGSNGTKIVIKAMTGLSALLNGAASHDQREGVIIDPSVRVS